jgi:hypothetical protein
MAILVLELLKAERVCAWLPLESLLNAQTFIGREVNCYGQGFQIWRNPQLLEYSLSAYARNINRLKISNEGFIKAALLRNSEQHKTKPQSR